MRRFLVAVVCLSGTAGALLGMVLTGSLSPSVAVSAPVDVAVRAEPDDTRPVITPPSFADIAERANPAVVNIDTLSREGSASAAAGNGSLRRQDGGGRSLRSREGVRRGAGTGFLVDPDGYILTSDHVVRQAERLTVRLRDGRSLRARRVGSDPDTDIALLKVDAAAPLPFVQLGDSDRLRVGEWVVAIGNPLAYEHTVTVGIVSFIGRKLYNASLDRYIQTDAAINLGNSGGPLIDATGAVIGINSAVSSHAANIGFAIPINTARDILPQLRRGHVTRGYIGAAVRELDPGLQRSLRLASGAGAVVQDIAADSPADRAGLRVYDVIVALNGRAIEDDEQFSRAIAAGTPGSPATLTVLRQNRPLLLTVKLAERPAPSGRAGTSLGLSVRTIDPEFARRVGLRADTGVIVSHVEAMSPAYDARLQQGHVVLEINRQPVRSVRDFHDMLAAAAPGDVLTCYVYQPERRQHALLTLTID